MSFFFRGNVRQKITRLEEMIEVVDWFCFHQYELHLIEYDYTFH